MRYFLILFMFIPRLCFSQPINEKYSYQAYPYHGVSFKEVDVKEFNNTTIIGSCFYQEWTEGDVAIVKDIFPNGMTGVVFQKCNLDNVLVPVGNVIMGGTNEKIKVQNDLSDWILDKDLKPIEPMDKEFRLEKSISIDPIDIPLTKQEKDVFEKADISN